LPGGIQDVVHHVGNSADLGHGAVSFPVERAAPDEMLSVVMSITAEGPLTLAEDHA
jgi:hypothetical protein